MSLALGPVARLMTCSLYAVLISRISWRKQLQLSDEVKQDLNFWPTKIQHFNEQSMWPKPSAVRVVYSDASCTGYSGYAVEHGGGWLQGNGGPTKPHMAETQSGKTGARITCKMRGYDGLEITRML